MAKIEEKKFQKIDKILICGIGSIGRKYIKTIKLIWPKKKIGILRSGYGKNYREIDLVDYQFVSIKNAINWEPDTAIISTPAPFHLELALSLGRKNIPLLIEKPIGTGNESEDHWAELKKISLHTTILVGYQLRFDACSEYLKRTLSDEKYGKVIEADFYCGSWLPDWRKDINYKETVSSKTSLGGGVLLELSHEIDMANWIFGKLNFIGSTISNSKSLEIDTFDNAGIIFRNKNGSLITIRINFCSRPSKRYLRVRTNSCEIKWDLINKFLQITDKNNVKKILCRNNKDLLASQLQNLFECIENNVIPRCSIEDGLEVLDMINKVLKMNKLQS